MQTFALSERGLRALQAASLKSLKLMKQRRKAWAGPGLGLGWVGNVSGRFNLTSPELTAQRANSVLAKSAHQQR